MGTTPRRLQVSPTSCSFSKPSPKPSRDSLSAAALRRTKLARESPVARMLRLRGSTAGYLQPGERICRGRCCLPGERACLVAGRCESSGIGDMLPSGTICWFGRTNEVSHPAACKSRLRCAVVYCSQRFASSNPDKTHLSSSIFASIPKFQELPAHHLAQVTLSSPSDT